MKQFLYIIGFIIAILLFVDNEEQQAFLSDFRPKSETIMKELWMLPLIIALLFLSGTWMFFDPGEMTFVFYAVVYFVLGMLSMLISWFVKKKCIK